MITEGLRRYSYYPGCSLTSTNRAYDRSTRAVAEHLGLELIELEDWNCCGATAYLPIREKRAFVLSARNLSLAEKSELPLATVCNACYVVLRKTNKYFAEDPQLRRELVSALAAGGYSYGGGVPVRHFMEIVVREVGEVRVRQAVRRPLTGLKVACYSGCQLSRPFVDTDDPDYPRLMETLIGWLGAEVLPYPLAAKCCGGMAMTTDPPTGRQLSGLLLREAKCRGADCVATACPLCQINLEAYQGPISRALKADCRIPVLYFTQLMGVAFDLPAKQLAIHDSLTPVRKLLAEKVGLR